MSAYRLIVTGGAPDRPAARTAGLLGVRNLLVERAAPPGWPATGQARPAAQRE